MLIRKYYSMASTVSLSQLARVLKKTHLPAQRPAMPSKSTPSQHGHVAVVAAGVAAAWPRRPHTNAYPDQHATRRASHRAHGTRHRRTITATPTYHMTASAHRHVQRQESIVAAGTDAVRQNYNMAACRAALSVAVPYSGHTQRSLGSHTRRECTLGSESTANAAAVEPAAYGTR